MGSRSVQAGSRIATGWIIATLAMAPRLFATESIQPPVMAHESQDAEPATSVKPVDDSTLTTYHLTLDEEMRALIDSTRKTDPGLAEEMQRQWETGAILSIPGLAEVTGTPVKSADAAEPTPEETPSLADHARLTVESAEQAMSTPSDHDADRSESPADSAAQSPAARPHTIAATATE